MSTFRSRTICMLVLITAAVPSSSPASEQAEKHWVFTTRLFLSGSSDHSEPDGFSIYSSLGLEASAVRRMGSHWSAEACVRTESREVDEEQPFGPANRLGSLELLPVTLTARYAPFISGGFQPYAGAGACLTVAWEKSGVLDSLDVGAHFGPAAQLGFDLALGSNALFNFDLRWNTLTCNIKNNGVSLAKLKVDPLSLGVGVGFRL